MLLPLLVALLQSAPPLEVPAPPLAMAISGGVSLGAYEAGLSWGLLRYAKQTGSSRLVAVTGASAGNVNALLTVLAWCERADSGRLMGRPTQNVFHDTWVPVGLDVLLAGDEPEPRPLDCGHPERTAAVSALLPPGERAQVSAVLRPDELLCRSVELAEAMRHGRFDACDVPLAFTVTRARPGRVSVSEQIEVDTQRFSVLMRAVATPGGPLRLLPIQLSTDAPAVGLTLHPPTSSGAVPPTLALDYARASSAFPVAFDPVPIEHCVPEEVGCAYPQPASPLRRGASCAPGLVPCREPFLDGGVFDNVPLGLAVALAEAYQDLHGVRYLYVDPSRPRRPEPAGPPPRFGCRTAEDVGCMGLGHLLGFAGHFVDTARQYELQWVGRTTRFDTGERELVLTSRHPPVAGRYAGSYGAFIDRPLRAYDYSAGLYDAIHHVAEDLCVPSEEGACVPGKLPEVARIIGLYDPTEWATLDLVKRLAADEHDVEIDWGDDLPVLNGCPREAGDARTHCVVHQALSTPGETSLTGLVGRLRRAGYIPRDPQAVALFEDFDGWLVRLVERVALRLEMSERRDDNALGERLFEGVRFALASHLDARGAWALELDPSTVPDTQADAIAGRLVAHLALPYAVTASLRSRGLLIDLWEPTLRIDDSRSSVSVVISPWLRQRSGENLGSLALLGGFDRILWPVVGQLRLGPALFLDYDGVVPKRDRLTCGLDGRACFGARVQLGLFWDKLRLTGGLTRMGGACRWVDVFESPAEGCADLFLTLGAADVNGMLYWLARIF